MSYEELTVFNFLNFHDKRVMIDNKNMKCIQERCIDHVILKSKRVMLDKNVQNVREHEINLAQNIGT